MNKDVILGLVRHALTIAGGAAVANGTVSGTEYEQAIGGIVALIGVIWSVVAKRNAATPAKKK